MNEPPNKRKAGHDTMQVWGLDIHNSVFIVSLLVFLALLIDSVGAGESSGMFFNSIRKCFTSNFSWFLLISGTIFVLFSFLILSLLGTIRIGGKETSPEYSRFSWYRPL